MSASKIEWTDRSDWNPVRGCTRVSEGCRNCYAEIMAARFSGEGQWGHGFAHIVDTPQGRDHRWTGKVALDEKRLTLPLRWRKPARVFVSSTSDIFHESLPDEAIDRIFAVVALCPHLTFQALTKRAARMREYLANTGDFGVCHGTPRRVWQAMYGEAKTRAAAETLDSWYGGPSRAQWPLPNVWLGVSVEDQAAADERIPDLLATPAAVRFLSCEPLLGPVDLNHVKMVDYTTENGGSVQGWESVLNGKRFDEWSGGDSEGWPKIDWVIAGGESGFGARPMHPDWARSLRDQCAAANVPFFFKQWGEFAPGEIAGAFLDPAKPARGFTYFDDQWSECWSEVDGHRDDEPDVYCVGKSKAGRLLDGIEHSEFPA